MSDHYLERYPTQTICFSASLILLSYIAGSIIFYLLYPPLGFLFIFLALASLLISMKLRCTHCYYYGKYCNCGLGKLAGLFFEKSSPEEFKDRKKVIPTAIVSFGITFLPVLAGIILFFQNSELISLIPLIGYLLIGVVPNFFIRESICNKCMQGKLGCPAYEQMTKGKES